MASRRSLKLQNIILLIGSYIFYGWWDWRFLSLIFISTVVDFFIGKSIYNTTNLKTRNILLLISICTNLGILGFFKYFDFFITSAVDLLQLFHIQANISTLNILLPVGISFYTFQTLSYTIDIYRNQLKATKNFLDFATFVSFFPQLVAGPIERAVTFLPQIENPRKITPDKVEVGIYLIIWGLFKKVAVADRAALVANNIFNNYTSHTGIDILLGIFAFAIQIYGDFSGYTDIARGIAKLMGFDLMLNFRLPYFALNPTDFWNRWHISLSTWLRDYLYIPLGGNRKGPRKTYRNLFLTMLLGGLWHGAAWNFVIWGIYHGLILILFRLIEKKPIHKVPWSKENSKVRVVFQISFMFFLTLIGWFIFRVESVEQFQYMLTHLSFEPTNYTFNLIQDVLIFTFPLLIIDTIQYAKNDLFAIIKTSFVLRALVYGILICWMLIFGVRESIEFVYFQF